MFSYFFETIFSSVKTKIPYENKIRLREKGEIEFEIESISLCLLIES